METENKSSRSPQKRLSKQLLLGFGISWATVGLITLWVNQGLIEANLEQEVQQRAQSIAHGLEFTIEGVIELHQASTLRRVVQNYATLPAILEIAIVDPDGMTVVHSVQGTNNKLYTRVHPELATAIEDSIRTGEVSSVRTKLKGKSAIAQLLPFSSSLFSATGHRGLAIVIVDLKQIKQRAWRTFFTSTLTLGGGTLMILFLMGLLIQRYVLKPLKRLNDSVERSQQTGIFSIPAVLSANEIGFLANTFGNVFFQRAQVETALRTSEERERSKSQQLGITLQELRQTQAKLIHTEKMSSLGQIVAGVAHEINNPVSFIYSNIEPANEYVSDLLQLVNLYQKTYPELTPELQALTEEIHLDFLIEDLQKLLLSMKLGASRIRDIVLSLRTFSRLSEADIKAVDIHESIDSSLLLLQHRLKQAETGLEVEIVKKYGQLPLVECYASELNQVFLHILNNAIDALETVTNKSGRQTEKPLSSVLPGSKANFDSPKSSVPACQIRIRTEVLSEERVAIYIADNGPGIPDELQARLFDPFFTTKPIGQGTGLGLSICYQIVVDKHGGNLKCFSELGHGSEFAIEIPVHSLH